MCHQTVCLAQAALERRGIVTASLSMMPEITRRVGALRALAVPFPLGHPLGEPGNPALQRRLLEALLELVGRTDVPVLATWDR